MRYRVELDRETDGRYIAEVPDLPGVIVYGATREQALHAAAVGSCCGGPAPAGVEA